MPKLGLDRHRFPSLLPSRTSEARRWICCHSPLDHLCLACYQRRYSHPTRQSSPPTPRDDSIDLVSPPVSTTVHQDTISSRNSLDSTHVGVCYAESQHSPPYSTFTWTGREAEDVDQVFGAPDPPMALSIGSLARKPFSFPAPPSEIPVLKHPTSMTSAEDVVDPQLASDGLPHKDSSTNQEEGAPPAVVGTSRSLSSSRAFPISRVATMLLITHLHPSSSMGTKMASPSRATGPLSSPISLKSTEEVGEPDYDSLYQCLGHVARGSRVEAYVVGLSPVPPILATKSRISGLLHIRAC
jgi:hypothetical protein